MQNINTQKVSYDAKYDLLKFFLSIFVIAIHANLFPYVLYPWLRIAVPLFFILSSYFLFSRLQNTAPDAHGKILKKFVLRNAKLYFYWLLILLPYTLYLRSDLYIARGVVRGFVHFVHSIIFSSTFAASWFITASVFGVLIIYFLSKWIRNDYIILVFSLLAFCFVTLRSSYSSIIATTPLSAFFDFYFEYFGTPACSFPAAIFWVFVGKCFADKKIRFSSVLSVIVLFVISCAGLFLEWRYVMTLDGSYSNDSYFMLLPVCILAYAGILKIRPFQYKHSPYFRRASTVIYVSHCTLVFIFSDIIKELTNAEFPLINFILAFVCSIALYALIEFLREKFAGRKIEAFLKALY